MDGVMKSPRRCILHGLERARTSRKRNFRRLKFRKTRKTRKTWEPAAPGMGSSGAFDRGPNLGAQKGPWVMVSPLLPHSGDPKTFPTPCPSKAGGAHGFPGSHSGISAPESPQRAVGTFKSSGICLEGQRPGGDPPDTDVPSPGLVTPSQDRDTREKHQEREDRAARPKLLGNMEGAGISMSEKQGSCRRSRAGQRLSLDAPAGFDPPSIRAGFSLGRSSREMFCCFVLLGSVQSPHPDKSVSIRGEAPGSRDWRIKGKAGPGSVLPDTKLQRI